MLRKIISKLNNSLKLEAIFDVFNINEEIPEPQLDDIVKMIEESEPPQELK